MWAVSRAYQTGHPGLISTNFVQRQGVPAELMRKAERKIAGSHSRVPCGRPGTPEGVAEAILFLADRYIIQNQLVTRQYCDIASAQQAA
ncbi:hypothetical protein TELCIR_07946 [Teladorsagia circumcincta]|uniref:Uncharacterized protein n=1 Tax=Teladorsagia circumcincta TaxID=45464 RepID=A0A2G9UJ88_TELCI|nr:hypothetical protein TELCIR_07946 [Teladorsagia circumcincta]